MGYPAPSFTEAPEVAMRLEVKDGINDSVLINDAYNLDLNSLALALDYLHNVALSRRRTLVLSDIAQSGLTDDDFTAAWREWSRGQASIRSSASVPN